MKLSVVIPTLNEERCLPAALASIPGDAEAIVVDGGSADRTREVAEELKARVVAGRPGRGAQSNLGAKHTRGETLLFLHADCVLDRHANEAIEKALSDPRVIGGSFRQRIRPATFGLRMIAFGSNLRARLLNLPYGDQALFVRREVFEELGGYREIPIMEDVEFVRRLKKRGRLRHLEASVTTTPRHWESLGPFLTTLVNWMAIVAYLLGVPPSRLAGVYHRLRERPSAAGARGSMAASND